MSVHWSQVIGMRLSSRWSHALHGVVGLLNGVELLRGLVAAAAWPSAALSGGDEAGQRRRVQVARAVVGEAGADEVGVDAFGEHLAGVPGDPPEFAGWWPGGELVEVLGHE